MLCLLGRNVISLCLPCFEYSTYSVILREEGNEDCAVHRHRDSPQMVSSFLPLELRLPGAVAALFLAEPVLNVTAC